LRGELGKVLKHWQIDGGGEAVEDGECPSVGHSRTLVSHCLTLGRPMANKEITDPGWRFWRKQDVQPPSALER